MKTKITPVVFLLIVIGVIGWQIENSPPGLSTISPNETYMVELTGDLEPGLIQIDEQVVSFNLYKSGVRVASNVQMTSFDFYEHGFLSQYPNYEWVNNNLLRFIDDNSPEPKDSLLVSNRTESTILYLNISQLDLYLIFDIQPNSSVKIKVPRYKWQSWVSVSGQFANGESIQFTGLNFFHQDKFDKPLHYCVSVTDNGVILNSLEVEGRRQDYPTIPMASECSQD